MLKGNIIKWQRYIAIFLMLALACFFLFRNILLHKAINYIHAKVKKNYSAELDIKDARFTGLFNVNLTGFTLLSANGDTLANLDTIEAVPSASALLLFHFRADQIRINNGSINVRRMNDAPTSNNKQQTSDYAASLSHLFKNFFTLIPNRIELSNIYLNYIGIASRKDRDRSSLTPRNDSFDGDSVHSNIHLLYFNLNNYVFDGLCEDESGHQQWKATGELDNHKKSISIRITGSNNHASLPLIDEMFHAAITFDTMNISLQERQASTTGIEGNLSSTRFSIYQKKLADDTIRIDNFSFNYRFNISNHGIELDSISLFTLNDISFHPYFRLDNNNGNDGDTLTGKEYALNINSNATPATAFFHSLPQGMFDAVRDIKAGGTLEYSMHFMMNTAQPDSLEFSSEMKKENFRIQQLGDVNFFKINNEFEYTAYERDTPYRTFSVGTSNPDYTPLDQISPYLRNAILTSEDGSFYYDNGFNEDAFRKSIAEDYRKEGFVRGGSTITMQLVKNVFLNRHKTIARKAEEALITWLIESNHLCSKERMYEVYLNIIELGPGVYGVGEASRFYFNKKPSQLTLSESIFIAGLLPHPKWFKYSFDEQGNLKPYLADYYRVVSNFMLRKNLITQQEYDDIHPNVNLTGPAKSIVVPSDTILIE